MAMPNYGMKALVPKYVITIISSRVKPNLDAFVGFLLRPRLAVRYAHSLFAKGTPDRWCIQTGECARLGEGLAPPL